MKLHPSVKRWLPAASKSKTAAGKCAAALANYITLRSKFPHCLPTALFTDAHFIPTARTWRVPPRRGFTTSDRATRRYAADPLYARKEDARRIRCLIQQTPYDGPSAGKISRRLPKLLFSTALAEEQGVKLCRIGKDWKITPDYYTRLDREPGKTHWKNGRPKSYDRAVTDNHVRSFADARRKDRITLYFHRSQTRLVAPAGYVWNVDANGLRLLRPDGADYHPLADDLLHPDWAANLVAKLEANAAVRLEALKNERAVATADRRGVRVGMMDSLAAGNCQAGTESFARRHGLNPKAWYAPAALLKLANGDAQRVRVAISVAARRHDRLACHGAEVFYPATP